MGQYLVPADKEQREESEGIRLCPIQNDQIEPIANPVDKKQKRKSQHRIKSTDKLTEVCASLQGSESRCSSILVAEEGLFA